jgi:exodeoxyribonuclease VII large subunit
MLEQNKQRLTWLSKKNSDTQRQILVRLQKQLGNLGPMQVLKRGYSMNTDGHGQLLSSISQIQTGDTINIHFHDGEAKAKTIAVSKEKTS